MPEIKQIIVIFCVLWLVASCRKEIRFPEDPRASRLSPAERLQGLWRLREYTFNEASVISQFGPRIDPLNLFVSCVTEEGVSNVVVKGRTFPQVRCKLEPDFLTIGPHSRDSAFVKGFYSPLQYDTTRFDHLAFWKITKLYGDEFNIIFETDTGTFKMFFNRFQP